MTLVNRLRIRSSRPGAVQERTRAEGMLDSASLHPMGLPRESIVCIRSLGDPLPGTLELWRIGARVPIEWEHAFAARVGGLIRSAARPIHEAVPPNAEAILFTDRAELLACLAMDWVTGQLLNHWWWHAMIRGVYQERFVVNKWLESSGSVPAALDHMSRRGRLPAFVLALKRDDVRQLSRAIIIKFGLREMWPTVAGKFFYDPREEIDPVISPLTEPSRQSAVSQSSSPTGRLGPEAPWRIFVPESDDRGLDFERQLFPGIGLMLHRAPSEVRSTRFAQEVTAWYRESSSGHRVSADTISEIGLSGKELHSPLGKKLSTRAMPEGGRQGKHPISRAQPAVGPIMREKEILPREEPLSEITSNQLSGSLPAVIAENPSSVSPPLVSPLLSVQHTAAPGERIETGLGGLFYLINVAIYLNLYPDFTRPLEPGLSMPIWDFIWLVGRRMLAGQVRDDPVWRFLARLAGRSEEELPGKQFEPPDEWRIPVEWLKPFGRRSVWTWSVEGERLRIRHHEGFWILDVRTNTDPEKCLREETGAYSAAADFKLRRGKRRPIAASSVERWLDWIVPFILARLRLAFGPGGNKDAVNLLLNNHAEVEAGDARLDICLSLSDLPISIRFAGLDRDPGWVPAAGRFVAFHYI
jgi:hypothetical protein